MIKDELERELVGFDLDSLHSAARENLFKLAVAIARLSNEEWQQFIRAGALDLKELASKSGVSRSSLYQNEHLKKYLLSKAEKLLKRGQISVLPYRSGDFRNSDLKAQRRKESSHRDSTDKSMKEMAKQLEALKQELKKTRRTLEYYKSRDLHLFETGRMPY